MVKNSCIMFVLLTHILVAPQTVRANSAEDTALKMIIKLHGKVQQDGKVVDLRHTEVTDADLKCLAGLQKLNRLDLSATKVTDAGLKELAALKELNTLNLSATRVTGTGLKELVVLKKLTTLYLCG